MSDTDHRMVGKIDRVDKLLKSFGLEVPDKTAERYTKLLMGITQERESVAEIKGGIFEEKGINELVVEKDIPIFSYCEHHILPWFGQVNIGYIAKDKVLGISKFTRIVNLYSAGVTIQERVTNDIAQFFVNNVSADVMVMVEAIHTCKVARGVQNPFSRSITIVNEGVFRDGVGPRMEFFESILSSRRSS